MGTDSIEVPIFYGDNPEEVEPWVSWIGDFAYDQGFSDLETRQFAYGFMEGEAHDWYCEELSRSVFRSWADLKLRLFIRFSKRVEDTKTVTLSFQDRMKQLTSLLDLWNEEDKVKKQQEEESLAPESYSTEIASHVGGSLTSFSLEPIPPMIIREEKLDLSIEMPLMGKQSGELKEKDGEGDDHVHQVFDQMTVKGKWNTKKKKRKRWKKYLLKVWKFLVVNRRYGKEETSLSCGNDGSGFDSTRMMVRQQFERDKLRKAKSGRHAYHVFDQMSLRRSLGERRLYQFVEAPSTRNNPATKPSSSVLVRAAVKLGKTRQSPYFPMFYQNTFAFGDVNKLLESVGSEEKNGCIAGRANQVWEPGGPLSPKSQLSWVERLAGVRILKLPDTHIETYIGAELLNEMQRRVMKPDWLLCGTLIWGVEKIEADKLVMNKMQESGIKVQMLICATVMDEYFKSGNSTKGLNLLEEKLKLDVEVTFFTLFPEESTSQVCSSSKDIGRGVATDVTFIGEHSEDHLSSFFSYGRFSSPRPPERSFSHPIPFKTALLTFGFSFDESNIIRSIIQWVYKLGLHVDNEQVENRKVQRLPLARWVSKSDVFAFRAAIQLTMACTEINKDLGQGLLHALLNDGYVNVSRTQNSIGELLYWEETVTVRSCYVVVCRIFKGLQQPTRAPYRLLQLLSVPADMEPFGIKQRFSTTYKVFLLVQETAYYLKPSREAAINSTVLRFRLRKAMGKLVITVSILNLLVGGKVLQAETNASLNTGVNIKLGQEEVIVKWKGLQDWNCTRERHDNMEQQFPQLDLGDKVSFNGAGNDTCTQIGERPNRYKPKRRDHE